MFANNPYAQAGWYNPQNPHSISNDVWRSNSLPPTFGALPPPEPAQASKIIFEFYFNPDVLNCTVIGPKQKKFFEVKSQNSGMTTITKPSQTVAAIRWERRPSVEACGILAQQSTGDFLKLSPDKSFRTMIAAGRTYFWVPRSSGVYLYSAGPNTPSQYARISVDGTISKAILEITSEAFQAGLFEPCIISTVLLFSSRNLD